MFSINKNIHNCKVNTANAARLESERIFNNSKMACYTWNDQDNLGRFVGTDTKYTKAPGCNSAIDRVDVEDYLRPTFINSITLNAFSNAFQPPIV